jgi:hypothetical protein
MCEFLTIAELAAELRTSPKTLEYWRCHNTGPRWGKMGKRIVYKRAHVQAWLDTKVFA